MQNKIKDLRIRIDELSQLVKKLRPFETRRINIAKIPDGWNSQEFLKVSQEHRYSIEDGEKGIEPIPYYFKELENSYNSLILAKAWLGKILQELGSDSPYKNDGKRKTIDDIEPTVDTIKDISSWNFTHNNHLGFFVIWEDKSYIEKIDWLREEVKKIITQYRNLEIIEDLDIARKISLISRYIYQHLSEARFWLGFELARIKKVKNNE